jgi:hypothetical protein
MRRMHKGVVLNVPRFPARGEKKLRVGRLLLTSETKGSESQQLFLISFLLFPSSREGRGEGEQKPARSVVSLVFFFFSY